MKRYLRWVFLWVISPVLVSFLVLLAFALGFVVFGLAEAGGPIAGIH